MIKQFVTSEPFLLKAKELLNEQSIDQETKDQINAIFNLNQNTILRIKTETLFNDFKGALAQSDESNQVLNDALQISFGIFYKTMPDAIALGFSSIAVNKVVNDETTHALPITYVQNCQLSDPDAQINWFKQLFDVANNTKIEYSILEFVDNKIVKTKHAFSLLSQQFNHSDESISDAIKYYLTGGNDLEKAIELTFKCKLNPMLSNSFISTSTIVYQNLLDLNESLVQKHKIAKLQQASFLLLEKI